MKIRDYSADYVGDQKPSRLFLKLVGVGLAVALVLCGAGWIFGWLKTGADIVSPANVKKQWEFAYEYDRSLTAIATNWCTFKQTEDQATGDAKEQRTSQRLAQEALYNARKAEYDAALANAFKAGLVAPPDVPKQAPTLPEKIYALHLIC